MVNAPSVLSAADLLACIRADVAQKRFKPIDLAREADLQPTTVYTMLDPAWSNRAVDNLEALAAAYQRITQKASATPDTAPATS